VKEDVATVLLCTAGVLVPLGIIFGPWGPKRWSKIAFGCGIGCAMIAFALLYIR
jgi:hypothetical protein